MNRLIVATLALVLIASACGSDNEELLTDLGLTTQEAACFTREYEARGLDIDRMLDPGSTDELTNAEQDDAWAVAVTCSGAPAAELDGGGDAGSAEGATDGNDPDNTDGSDEPDDGDEPDGDNSDEPDEPDDDNSDEPDDGDDAAGRTYDELDFLEQSFVDGIVEGGGSVEAGVCILAEFSTAGIEMHEVLEAADTDSPTPEMVSAIFECISDFSSDDFFDSPTQSGFTYGDTPELDALWDACDQGGGGACDELYWTSPVASDYEAFGNTCGNRFPDGVLSCVTQLGDSGALVDGYGSDPDFDVMWDACDAGDLESCDELYLQSPVGSEYESFGSTCGATTGDTFGGCSSSSAQSYGDDPALDALWDACDAGDNASCDEMYLFSPFGSDYELHGSLCAGRSEDELFGTCEATLG